MNNKKKKNDISLFTRDVMIYLLHPWAAVQMKPQQPLAKKIAEELFFSLSALPSRRLIAGFNSLRRPRPESIVMTDINQLAPTLALLLIFLRRATPKRPAERRSKTTDYFRRHMPHEIREAPDPTAVRRTFKARADILFLWRLRLFAGGPLRMQLISTQFNSLPCLDVPNIVFRSLKFSMQTNSNWNPIVLTLTLPH